MFDDSFSNPDGFQRVFDGFRRIVTFPLKSHRKHKNSSFSAIRRIPSNFQRISLDFRRISVDCAARPSLVTAIRRISDLCRCNPSDFGGFRRISADLAARCMGIERISADSSKSGGLPGELR